MGKPTSSVHASNQDKSSFPSVPRRTHDLHLRTALYRASQKIAGNHKIFKSKYYGFTHLTHADYKENWETAQLIPDGHNVRVIGKKGRIEDNLTMIKNYLEKHNTQHSL